MPIEYEFEITQIDESYDISIDEESYVFGVENPIQIVHGDSYTGEYTVTPSSETQTLSTSGLFMQADVIINPIPSNYGLITWDGSTLTVS